MATEQRKKMQRSRRGQMPRRSGQRSASASTHRAAYAEKIYVPAHDEQGVRGSHTGMIT